MSECDANNHSKPWFELIVLMSVLVVNIWVVRSSFSEARHRIERLEKLHELPQDTVFFTWPWDEDESREELGIPREVSDAGK